MDIKKLIKCRIYNMLLIDIDKFTKILIENDYFVDKI